MQKAPLRKPNWYVNVHGPTALTNEASVTRSQPTETGDAVETSHHHVRFFVVFFGQGSDLDSHLHSDSVPRKKGSKGLFQTAIEPSSVDLCQHVGLPGAGCKPSYVEGSDLACCLSAGVSYFKLALSIPLLDAQQPNAPGVQPKFCSRGFSKVTAHAKHRQNTARTGKKSTLLRRYQDTYFNLYSMHFSEQNSWRIQNGRSNPRRHGC